MQGYTGHPFIDIGIAAITAYSDKRTPDEVTTEDLEHVATYIEAHYSVPPLSAALTMSLVNSGFTQPAFDAEKKLRYARLVARSLGAEVHQSNEVCVFTGAPALSIPLSLKEGSDIIPGGRAYRQHIPMLTGEGIINFFPNGDSGLPISGIALLALQFLPMGCEKSGVGLLAVHSDNGRLMLRITRQFLHQNVEAVAKARAAGETKLPGSQWLPRTLLVQALIQAERERSAIGEHPEEASLTAFNFNNNKSGKLDIYYLPLEIVGFLRAASTTKYADAWRKVAERGWARKKTKNGKENPNTTSNDTPTRRNYLYDDLFTLPGESARFIRTYFLRIPRRGRFADDPRQTYSLSRELHLVSWPLVELFLRKVVHMDEQRLAQIRTLGDGLALYVRRQGSRGKRFYREFFTETSSAAFRARLIRANVDHIKDGQQPLFDLDAYIDVFEEGYEVMRPDWRLARDLVLMRMVDQLRDWLAQNPDAVPDPQPESEVEEAAS